MYTIILVIMLTSNYLNIVIDCYTMVIKNMYILNYSLLLHVVRIILNLF